MRGRSLLWAGPGVMLLGGRGPGAEPLAAEPSARAASVEPAELAITKAEDLLVPLPARGPAAGPAAGDAAAYAGSSVTKTKG
jgi:hypothetical protein